MRPVLQTLAVTAVLGMAIVPWCPHAQAQGYRGHLSARDAAGIGAQGTGGRTNPDEYESAPPLFSPAYRHPSSPRTRDVDRPLGPMIPAPGPQAAYSYQAPQPCYYRYGGYPLLSPMVPAPVPRAVYSYQAPQLCYYTYAGYIYYYWSVPQVSATSPAGYPDP